MKGYTAEVVTADFTSPGTDGKMGHIHNGKQPVGLYTPVANNTRDVGVYEPLVSEVRSDDKDDFDMYVVYKADKQKANVTYIDLDATGDARILEIQTAATAPATNPDAKTTYNVEKLQGKSHTKIPYLTAETIKKYEDLGYELVTDDYTMMRKVKLSQMDAHLIMIKMLINHSTYIYVIRKLNFQLQTMKREQ